MASPFDSQFAAVRSRIEHYANAYGIPSDVAVWQIWQESKFNPTANSPKGAKGIAQFMPAAASRFGVNVFDIESSLNGWGRYMSWLLRQPYINGDIRLALAGYNAGEGNVQKYGGVPPFRETQNYVAEIMRNAGAVSPATVGGGDAEASRSGMLILGVLVLALLL